MKQGKQIFWLLFGKQDRWYQGMIWSVRMLACEQQTHFRSSLLSLRKIAIFRRKIRDDLKCVYCSLAIRMHERDCGCDGRLVNGFCLVLGITLYNIKKERKLTNQSNDKTDKITPSRQTVMSPNALNLRYKQRSQINKEKQFSAHPCLNLLCFMNILLGLLPYRNRREMLRETLQADEENPWKLSSVLSFFQLPTKANGLVCFSLREQPTFCDAITGFRRKDVWATSAEILYWWPIITQIWVVLLIGWSKMFFRPNQSEALRRPG